MTHTDKIFVDDLVKNHYPDDWKRIHGQPTSEDVKQAAKQEARGKFVGFFERKRRLCRACRKLVTPANTAGGRNKRWHVDCVPPEVIKEVAA